MVVWHIVSFAMSLKDTVKLEGTNTMTIAMFGFGTFLMPTLLDIATQ